MSTKLRTVPAREPERFPFASEGLVRFNDCDPFGHANNSAYSTYLEQARLRILGGEFHDCILARVEIDFRSALVAGEGLLVESRCANVGRASFVLEHRISADGRLVAEASSTMVAYDYTASCSVPLTRALMGRLRVEADGALAAGAEAPVP